MTIDNLTESRACVAVPQVVKTSRHVIISYLIT